MTSSAFDTENKSAENTAGERLERDVIYTPGFDKRSDDPCRNYGISGGRLTFLIKGKKGAIQFMIGTGFYPPSAEQHLINHHHNDARRYAESVRVSGWDLGYHAYAPQYKDQSPMADNCHVLGGKCYYDGSGLQADEWLKEFLEGGTDWLWPKLEERYYLQFYGEYPAPATPPDKSDGSDIAEES